MAPATTAARPSGLRHAAFLAAALGLAAIAYMPALPGEMQFDDDLHVARALPRVSWDDSLAGRLLERPLTAATFALNGVTTGLDPVPLHATNVLVHLAASLLAWLLARSTFREAGHPRAEGLAVAVAGLFALHPLQSEAVAYLVQRGEELASALAIAAVLLMLRAERLRGSRAGLAAWGWAGISFIAAVAAKQIALATPVAYLAHRAFIAHRQPDRPHSWRWRLAIAAPFLAAAAILSTTLLYSLRNSSDAGLNAGELGSWRYLLTQAGVIVRYLRLLAWPSGQTIEHGVRPSPGLLDAPTLAAIAGIAGLIGAALALRAYAARRPAAHAAPAARVASFGVAWFLVWLAPTSSVVPLSDLMFEHRVYLASLGTFAAAAVAADLAIARFVDALRRRISVVAVAVAWLGLGALTYARATVWTRAETLWTEATVRTPGSMRAHWNLGSALDRRGDLEGALASFQRADMQVGPGAPPESVLQENIGSVLRRLGRAAEARQVIERALERDGPNPSLHDDLATLLLEAGELDRAAVHAREAIRLAPGHAPYWETLGEIARNRGDPATQLAAMRRAASLDPRFPERDAELGELAARLGHLSEACASWDRVIRWTEDGALRNSAEERRGALGCARVVSEESRAR